MNIKRAKEEIKNSIDAYLMKDEYGDYLVPAIRQRPILLMGPPGIGKTQIMEQIAKECKIGLVSYTITHHTRQSAIGLPFIQEKVYQGKTYSVTEYTMSEIIASVYDKIEATNVSEGILFIDEINCVSETLAPTMLQFLQCKMFGNQKVPDGWIIVAAGNPPEYNKSVRDFDVVTLDRIKKIDVTADFEVWKEYAYLESVHPAVISYLELKKDHFYKIETTIDGKLFATARGWEDLSQLIKVYESLGKTVDRDVVYQYIQHWKIAKDFANYLELYEKYKNDYKLEHILDGQIDQITLEKLQHAAFDERVSVIGLLIGKLSTLFKNYCIIDAKVTQLYRWLKVFKVNQSMEVTIESAQKDFEKQKAAEQLTKLDERILLEVNKKLEAFNQTLKAELLTGEPAFERVKELFALETSSRQELISLIQTALDHAFDFLETVFGDSQEMVIFITELNTNPHSIQFIKENGSDRYYQYNKGLLFNERHQDILQQLDQIEHSL